MDDVSIALEILVSELKLSQVLDRDQSSRKARELFNEIMKLNHLGYGHYSLIVAIMLCESSEIFEIVNLLHHPTIDISFLKKGLSIITIVSHVTLTFKEHAFGWDETCDRLLSKRDNDKSILLAVVFYALSISSILSHESCM
ncbi:hypothetical protein ACJX0J_020866, partial [Zea mays]